MRPDGWQSLAAVFPDYDDPALDDAGLVDRRARAASATTASATASCSRSSTARAGDRLRRPRAGTRRAQVPQFAGDAAVLERAASCTACSRRGRRSATPAAWSSSKATWTWWRWRSTASSYAVATLGTATTPVHVQKLFRQTDEVVFCFDGDAAGPQRRVARAGERACPCSRTARRRVPVPAGRRGPGQLRAQRGKAAFDRRCRARRCRCREFLLAELAAAGRPDVGGRARGPGRSPREPLVAQLERACARCLLRKQLRRLAGLPDSRRCAPARASKASFRRRSATRGAAPGRARLERSAPSLARSCVRGCLLIAPSWRDARAPRACETAPRSARGPAALRRDARRRRLRHAARRGPCARMHAARRASAGLFWQRSTTGAGEIATPTRGYAEDVPSWRSRRGAAELERRRRRGSGGQERHSPPGSSTKGATSWRRRD